MPPLTRPEACRGCPLDSVADGFAEPVGPKDSPLAFVGEALGEDEVEDAEPFVGRAGVRLWRVFGWTRIERDKIRIGNTISCRPPDNNLEGKPWERDAIAHCAVHREKLLSEPHKVFVALGGTAMRTLLGLKKAKGVSMENFHGHPIRDPQDRFWVVPTYHPSFLLRGKDNLSSVVIHDLLRAKEVAEHGWEPDLPTLVVNPPVDWFAAWCEQYRRVAAEVWLACDFETEEKSKSSEDEMIGEAKKETVITQANFSTSTGEGVTVPMIPPYDELVRMILGWDFIKLWWNGLGYDLPLAEYHGIKIGGENLDGMWMAHVLQTDWRLGLGFWCPMYSTAPPHKHLVGSDFGYYAAMDPVQTLRVGYGVAQDLTAEGLWEVYVRYVQKHKELILRPAERVGLLLDPPRLEALGRKLQEQKDAVDQKLMLAAPEEAAPLIPPQGWKKPREGAIEKRDIRRVLCCRDCGGVDVTDKHKCKKAGKTGGRGEIGSLPATSS